MPARPLSMPSSMLSPFPELDTDLSKDFVSLLAGVNMNSPGKEQSSTHSSCPVNLDLEEGTKDEEDLADSTIWPLQSPWNRDSELPSSNAERLIPFQADRSVSMIEETTKSPPGTRPPASRYKTELCRTFHESGSCKYGTKCQFAHGTVELRGMNRHPKYKTELCRTYHTIGFCPYGSRCHFIHNAEEQRFNTSHKAHRPPLLRHSVSCSGIPSSSSSSSSSSSISLLSASFASSLTSLSPFSPSSPVSPCFNPFASVGSDSTTSPVPLGLPVFGPVSPPHPTVQTPMVDSLQLQVSPWVEQGDPEMADKWDSLQQPENVEESTSACGNSQEAKRLPIFSFLSD
ncbi:uncharacterized protein ACNLHF_000199 [Anomaloglossus baeobatrachus]|uniref:uncharacterized protein LOC142250378 n=1 Tax=Anomaloglossus baeobatrachus TaxID=238106 RepID=UPI003F504740